MPRYRRIKPEFWSDDKTIELTHTERLCFIGLWNFCDDEGVHKLKPNQIKAEIFPADEITVEEVENVLRTLSECSLIAINEDQTLLKIKNWSKHQRIDKPQPSGYTFVEEIRRTVAERSKNVRIPFSPKTSQTKTSVKQVKANKVKTNKDVQISQFERFYDIYPRKQDKKRALTSFNRLNNDDQESCIEGVKAYNEYIKGNNISKEHIKMPSTYINGRNWEDELIVTSSQKSEYKLDTTGKSAIGYCSKCGISDFYDPAFVSTWDSFCCKSEVLPVKPDIQSEPKKPVNSQVRYKTQAKSMDELLRRYK